MKKTMILLLALVLLLCGCGQEAAPETEAVPETQVQTEPEKVFSLGTLENGVYTNLYAGIGCDFGEGWSVTGAEALQELPENVKELIAGSQMEQVMEGYPQIFDMAAENVDAYLAVNVVYTQITPQEQEAYAAMTEEETIDTTLAQADMIAESYAQAGMTVESMEKVQVSFLGQTHYAMRTIARSGEIPIYMVQVMDYTLGGYGVTLTATSYLEDNTQDVLALFYPVE